MSCFTQCIKTYNLVEYGRIGDRTSIKQGRVFRIIRILKRKDLENFRYWVNSQERVCHQQSPNQVCLWSWHPAVFFAIS
jgi:hypothetical protein